MLRNYLKITVRNLKRYAVYTSLNILGLTIGMATCLLILLFVVNEYRFDSFHNKADRIYRLNEIQDFGGMIPQHVALSMYTMGRAMEEDFSEVEAFVRFIGTSSLVEVEDEQFILDKALMVDSSIFDVFDFKLLVGDPKSVLRDPYSIVLTSEAALTIFGQQDPVGLTVKRTDGQVYTVTGIVEHPPETSHLQFDVLISINSREEEPWMLDWGSNWVVTYLLLYEGASPEAMAPRFPGFLESKKENLSDTYELYLQPLNDIHLGSGHVTHEYHNYNEFDGSYLRIFGLLGLFVILLATINFMNLSTARSSTRAREVGVRKAIGAQRSQLTYQFIVESVLQSVFAFVLAVGICIASIRAMNELAGRTLEMQTLFSIQVFPWVLGGIIIIGICAGLYPALALSAFKPVTVLKGKAGLSSSEKGKTVRSGLVITQFAVATVMIICTLVTFYQLRFLYSIDIGIDRDQVVVMNKSTESNEKYELIKQELERSPYIHAVTASFERLGSNINQWGTRVEDNEGVLQQISPSFLRVYPNFVDFYGIELTQGRLFSDSSTADLERAFLVNQAFVDEMGWDVAIGKRIERNDAEGLVIGVTENFNFNSLHNEVAPLLLSASNRYMNELSVRIDGANVSPALVHMEAVWGEHVNDWPFQYEFLDQHFEQLYSAEQQVSQIVGLVAGLAIFIACLGLFGLAVFAAEQRTKEIGVRKVLGASVAGIVGLMSMDFLRPVALSILIAIPLAYFTMQRWLEGFAFHITITAIPFIIAGVTALLIAFLTVGYQSLRAARSNPVDALRYE